MLHELIGDDSTAREPLDCTAAPSEGGTAAAPLTATESIDQSSPQFPPPPSVFTPKYRGISTAIPLAKLYALHVTSTLILVSLPLMCAVGSHMPLLPIVLITFLLPWKVKPPPKYLLKQRGKIDSPLTDVSLGPILPGHHKVLPFQKKLRINCETSSFVCGTDEGTFFLLPRWQCLCVIIWCALYTIAVLVFQINLKFNSAASSHYADHEELYNTFGLWDAKDYPLRFAFNVLPPCIIAVLAILHLRVCPNRIGFFFPPWKTLHSSQSAMNLSMRKSPKATETTGPAVDEETAAPQQPSSSAVAAAEVVDDMKTPARHRSMHVDPSSLPSLQRTLKVHTGGISFLFVLVAVGAVLAPCFALLVPLMLVLVYVGSCFLLPVPPAEGATPPVRILRRHADAKNGHREGGESSSLFWHDDTFFHPELEFRGSTDPGVKIRKVCISGIYYFLAVYVVAFVTFQSPLFDGLNSQTGAASWYHRGGLVSIPQAIEEYHNANSTKIGVLRNARRDFFALRTSLQLVCCIASCFLCRNLNASIYKVSVSRFADAHRKGNIDATPIVSRWVATTRKVRSALNAVHQYVFRNSVYIAPLVLAVYCVVTPTVFSLVIVVPSIMFFAFGHLESVRRLACVLVPLLMLELIALYVIYVLELYSDPSMQAQLASGSSPSHHAVKLIFFGESSNVWDLSHTSISIQIAVQAMCVLVVATSIVLMKAEASVTDDTASREGAEAAAVPSSRAPPPGIDVVYNRAVLLPIAVSILGAKTTAKITKGFATAPRAFEGSDSTIDDDELRMHIVNGILGQSLSPSELFLVKEFVWHHLNGGSPPRIQAFNVPSVAPLFCVDDTIVLCACIRDMGRFLESFLAGRQFAVSFAPALLVEEPTLWQRLARTARQQLYTSWIMLSRVAMNEMVFGTLAIFAVSCQGTSLDIIHLLLLACCLATVWCLTATIAVRTVAFAILGIILPIITVLLFAAAVLKDEIGGNARLKQLFGVNGFQRSYWQLFTYFALLFFARVQSKYFVDKEVDRKTVRSALLRRKLWLELASRAAGVLRGDPRDHDDDDNTDDPDTANPTLGNAASWGTASFVAITSRASPEELDLATNAQLPSWHSIADRISWHGLARHPYFHYIQMAIVLLATIVLFLVFHDSIGSNYLVGGLLLLLIAICLALAFLELTWLKALWAISAVYLQIAVIFVACFEVPQFHDWLCDAFVPPSSNRTLPRCSLYIPTNATMEITARQRAEACLLEIGLRSTPASASAFKVLPWFAGLYVAVVQLCIVKQFQSRMKRELMLGLEHSRQFNSLMRTLRGFLHVLHENSAKLTWIALFIASVQAKTVLHSVYAVFFLLDIQGKITMFFAATHLIILYWFDFSIFPDGSSQLVEFIGVSKRGALPNEFLVGPAIVFLFGVATEIVERLHTRIKDSRRPRRAPMKIAPPSSSGAEHALPITQELIAVRSMRYIPATATAATTAAVPSSPNLLQSAPLDSKSLLGFIATKLKRASTMFTKSIHYMYSEMFHDVGFEFLLLALLIGIAVAPLRIVAVVFTVILVLLVLKRRDHCVRSYGMLRSNLIIFGLLYAIQQTFFLGFPWGTDVPGIGHFLEKDRPDTDRYDLVAYFGGQPSKTVLAVIFVIISLLRLLLKDWELHYSTALDAEPLADLGVFLAAKEREIHISRRKLLPLEYLIPRAFRAHVNMLRKPSLPCHYFLVAWAAAFPVAPLVFIDGISSASVLHCFIAAVSVVLQLYRLRIFWRFYKYWHLLVLFYVGVLCSTAVCNFPLFAQAIEESPVVPSVLGLTTGMPDRRTMGLSGWRIAAVLAVIIQERFFYHPSFLGKLLNLHDEVRGSHAAHLHLLSLRKKHAEQEETKLREKEQARADKLRNLHHARDETALGVTQRPPEDLDETQLLQTFSDLRALMPTADQLEESTNDEGKLTMTERLVKSVHELTEYLSRDTYEGDVPTSPIALLVVIARFIRCRTAVICYFSFFINFATSGTLLDAILSASVMVYGSIWNPNPTRAYWQLSLWYSSVGIVLKSVVRLIATYASMSINSRQALSVIFVRLTDMDNGEDSTSNDVIVDILMDFVCVMFIMYHLHVSDAHGVYFNEAWEEEKRDADDAEAPAESCARTTEYETVTSVDSKTSKAPDTALTDRGGTSEQMSASGRKDQAKGSKKDPQTSALQKIVDNVTTFSGIGVDFYTPTFLLEAVSVAYAVINFFSLAGRAGGSFVESVEQNFVPGELVLLLLFLILVMVIDRILYTYSRSNNHAATLLKCVFHILLMVSYHVIYIIWVSRVAMQRSGVKAAGGATLLSLKWVYGMLSAQQIRSGYALFRRHDPFSTSAHWIWVYAYYLYRRIPFLWDLRVMLDWTCTRTTLNFSDFLKVEDVFYSVYVRYGEIVYGFVSNPRRGTSYPLSEKFTTGALLCLIVLVLIFFPLMNYSSFNPNLAPNRITSAEMTVSIGNLGNIYEARLLDSMSEDDLSATLPPLLRTRPSWTHFEYVAEPRVAQLIVMDRCSSSLWQVSPAGKILMLERLEAVANGSSPANSISLNVQLRLQRARSTAASTTDQAVSFTEAISRDTARSLYDAISSTSLNASTKTTRIPSMFDPILTNTPVAVLTFADKENLNPSAAKIACELRLVREDEDQDSYRYWCMQCQGLFSGGLHPSPDDPEAQCSLNGRNCAQFVLEDSSNPIAADRPSNVTSPYIVVSSDPVPGDVNLIPMNNIGIVALYTTFVFAVGGLLRSALTGMAHRIVLSDVADPRCLAELLSYIYLSRGGGRQRADTIDLALEEQLFFELVDLLRSPDGLMARSGARTATFLRDGRRRDIAPMLEW